MKRWGKYISIIIIILLAGGFYSLNADLSIYSSEVPEVTLIPEVPQDVTIQSSTPQDTASPSFPVAKVVPDQYEDVIKNRPIDLKTPSNLGDGFQYNPLTNKYEWRSKIGDADVIAPLTLTPEEYYKYSLQRSMDSYFRNKYSEEFLEKGEGKKDALSMFDFQFDLGPAEKIFGPGGVKLNAQGSALIKMGITRNSTQNPTLSERQRNRTAFDFDTQVQANIAASVGDKVNFDLNYNTESTFDFDTRKLKLGYTGKEDEIIKVLEAGNVSMNTTNSLIRGGAALFGIKTELQFGKLTVGAVFSQQESQARSVSSRGNEQTTPFEIKADEYDNNTHYFLGHYFHDEYDTNLKYLPQIQSGITIGEIEVWITNRRSNYDEARNIVAFTDLGEYKVIGNKDKVTSSSNWNSKGLPGNRANTLYDALLSKYTGARIISSVNQTLEGDGFTGGVDYEKIENARKLSPSEYTLNSVLGYISLRTPLQDDEVLAVAYKYTAGGQAYQVGELSTDNPNGSTECLYLKSLKGSTVSPDAMTWKLMMKNVYTISSRGLENDNFRLDIKYLNDTTGAYLNYITVKDSTLILLRLENLDRLNSNNQAYPDGFFDYVEGTTVISQTGKIIFPVVEPFGSHLRAKIEAIANKETADAYVYQELYDSTLTIARQTAEKNKFILAGEYKGQGSSNINLDGYNIARGSVTVTANGTRLVENVDYTVDYSTGNVTVINPAYENASINISSENQSSFAMQRKTMMGLNLNYAFNPNFNIGATIMNLSEMPVTMKTQPGQESVNNTLFGFNTNFTTQSQALTNLLDKIPLLELTAPSQITFSAEYAQLIPGHYKSEYGGDYSYLDDFEQAKISIDLRSPYGWNLSSTPSMFDESKLTNNIKYGNNRALLAWYTIDPLFTRNSSLTPTHIRSDKETVSSNYVREILESELFPNKDQRFGESATIPVLNLAYYPKERGPYNLDADGMNPDGTLSNPKARWGGITRRIESGQTDFEANNVETIEFWLMDPFLEDPNAQGGDLYFNLGDISEDVLKDEEKFYESGLPIDGDPTKVKETEWGLVPTQQSSVIAFDNSGGARKIQDVGLNGLSTEAEFTFDTYIEYLEKLRAKLDPEVRAAMEADPFSPLNDPAGDNYHYYRGSDYDQVGMPVLGRYKRYNGTEGNSADADDSPESYSTAAKSTPDVEDINQDNTLNEGEKYFQYRISIRPNDLVEGQNFVVQKMSFRITVNDKPKDVTWYQFKVPLSEYEGTPVGGIRDFKTIRFARMFLTNFADSTILRFGTLELVRGDWRVYTKDISNPNLPPSGNTSVSVSTVNIEENGEREPVNYVMPPGVNRILDPGQPQLRQQNEQAISVRISDLSPGDARAIYRGSGQDARQYKRLQMFAHAEKFIDDVTNLQDNELSIFLRLGTDYTNNYYEYEIPLKLTPHDQYGSTNVQREIVWPEANMFDFPFEIMTDLKLARNKEKRKAGSDVTYYTPFSQFDPNKPLNKITVVGNPTISNIKVIMIGVRNNSHSNKSVEVWANELRLTEFNEDGGWAGNANLFLGLSDLGSINFSGSKETAGFGSLDQGIMDRNLDDTHQINISTQIDWGRFFPEKAKVSIPFYYTYREEVVSPKYDPLDQDILLKDALDAAETDAERDSIKSYAQDKLTSRSLDFNSVRVDIRSKTPMPYDPANFTFDYSSSEDKIQNATTEYERKVKNRLNINYSYSPMFKPWQPFARKGNANNTESASGRNRNNTSGGSKGNKFFQDIGIGYLPSSISINSDIYREYWELQLRDLGNAGIPVSFREDFYWNRSLAIQWNLTKNLNLNFQSGTKAQIEAPYVQVNKHFNPDEYSMWKDSVLRSIRDLGSPLSYRQTFTASYSVPFKNIPVLDFMSATLNFNSGYEWERGTQLEDSDYDTGNMISNTRTIGFDNISFNLTNLYNKSKFLEKANKKYVLKKTTPANTVGSTTGRRAARQNADEQKKATEAEKRKKKYEGEVTLNPDSATQVTHQLNNKRLRITARGADGKLYQIKYKAINENSIQIKNKDTANIKLTISQLPPLDDLRWYKIAQGAARALMMVRNVGFSYNESFDMDIPYFRTDIGDFFGQKSVGNGYSPGLDFAFGFAGKDYLDKAMDKGWILQDDRNNTPATFNKRETFSFTALLEPFVGMQINLNAARSHTHRDKVYVLENGTTQEFSGDFRMTTITLGTAFESSNASNGYHSKAFETFLNNRSIIAGRLENIYSGTRYPNSGFISDMGMGGQPYDPTKGSVDPNSIDVLIPAFLAAYTGKNAGSIGLSAFPSLKSILPNWKATYSGLIQIPFINKHFKSVTLEHQYSSVYTVGTFNSFLGWVGTDIDGIGYIQSVTTENPSPSSPYSITAVSITEAFNPLFGINSIFLNNMSVKMQYNKTRNLSLNISSYQIVEVNTNDLTIGAGYRFDNFNQVLKIRKTGGENFNNEMQLSADISYKKTQSMIRKIQDNTTQATAGDSNITLRLAADYNMSKLITLQAFYDRQISKPLISATAYPSTTSSFGVSVKVSLTR